MSERPPGRLLCRLGVSAATRADFLKELIGKRRGPAACQEEIVETCG